MFRNNDRLASPTGGFAPRFQCHDYGRTHVREDIISDAMRSGAILWPLVRDRLSIYNAYRTAFPGLLVLGLNRHRCMACIVPGPTGVRLLGLRAEHVFHLSGAFDVVPVQIDGSRGD